MTIEPYANLEDNLLKNNGGIYGGIYKITKNLPPLNQSIDYTIQ